MPVAKDQIRQIISENNINSVADVYALLKDSFKDILQELMEAEMDASLGYEKNQKGNIQSSNKRNGHSPKTLKSQYSEFQIDVPIFCSYISSYFAPSIALPVRRYSKILRALFPLMSDTVPDSLILAHSSIFWSRFSSLVRSPTRLLR